MSYLLLIMEPKGQRHQRGVEAGRVAFDDMVRYAEGLQARGLLLGMNSLKSGAVRLTVNGGQRAVVDGPFTEAKELVGGYFLVDVATREEALALAAECPAAAWAAVEVRETGPCYE